VWGLLTHRNSWSFGGYFIIEYGDYITTFIKIDYTGFGIVCYCYIMWCSTRYVFKFDI